MTAEQEVRGEAPAGDAAQTERLRRALEGSDTGDFTLPVRHTYDGAQVEVIRQTVARDCNQHELAMFLEVSARYGLDPFIREIFAAKFNGSSGAVTIFAGRDGLLKVAKRTDRFKRMVSAVVREQDEYDVEVMIDPDDPEGDAMRCQRIHHKRAGLGTKARGPIVGAYALVWREGDEQPWFAEATWEDYGEKNQRTSNGKDTLWTLGKGTPEAMMRKVPESIALRMAFGMAGLYGQEELPVDQTPMQPVVAEGEQPLVDWGDDELGGQLRALVGRANEVVPNSWRDTKVAMRINVAPDAREAARVKLRDALVRFLEPRDREFVERIVPREAEVVDPRQEPSVKLDPDRQPHLVTLVDQLPDDVRTSKHLERVLAAVEGEALSAQLVTAVVNMVRQQEERERAATPEPEPEALPLAEAVPDEEYSEQAHLAIQDNVVALRAQLESASGEEEEALAADLEVARDRLAAMNETAARLGRPQLAER